MAVLVTNKIRATLTLQLKSGLHYFIPPRVRDMKLDINQEDIVDSAPELHIRPIYDKDSRKRRGR